MDGTPDAPDLNKEPRMPISLTFDLENATPLERNRIQCAFERLGWENLGGSTYRYPRLGSTAPEDWFNHVVPALMLFRCFLLNSNTRMTRYSLEAHSSVGVKGTGRDGMPLAGAGIHLHEPTHQSHFGEGKLRGWLDSSSHPYH